MIQAAIDYGLDGLAFTDHHFLVPPGQLAELNQKYTPFRIFAGIEITFREAQEDVLVLGIQDARLETTEWRSYPELWRFVRERGGFLALAHPYRYHPTVNIDVWQYPPDAIELHTIHVPLRNERMVRALGDQLDVALFCNSDAHHAQDVGIYYNEVTPAAAAERDVLDAIRGRDFLCRGRSQRIEARNEDVAEPSRRLVQPRAAAVIDSGTRGQ